MRLCVCGRCRRSCLRHAFGLSSCLKNNKHHHSESRLFVWPFSHALPFLCWNSRSGRNTPPPSFLVHLTFRSPSRMFSSHFLSLLPLHAVRAVSDPRLVISCVALSAAPVLVEQNRSSIVCSASRASPCRFVSLLSIEGPGTLSLCVTILWGTRLPCTEIPPTKGQWSANECGGMYG